MGNCIVHDESSQVIWGGEDWTPALMTDDEKLADEIEEQQQQQQQQQHQQQHQQQQQQQLVRRSKRIGYSKVREVKIKITKKEFEEWLGRIDVQHNELCVEQTLGELMKFGVVQSEMHHTSWRPRLKSIPEL
ncbi:hypothetical protein SOVF_159470 [Spinacia oleracea]|nr:hypothetical protein SOVF_159470 [Spinacia oleracea]